MKPLSLRWKLVFWCSGLTGACLAAFAVGTAVYVQAEQMELARIEMMAEANRLTNLHFKNQGVDDETVFQSEAFKPWIGIVLLGPDGIPKLRSRHLSDQTARKSLDGGEFETLDQGDQQWKVTAFPLGEDTLVIGYDLDEVQSVVDDMLKAYAITFPIAIALAGIGAWIIVGVMLKPLRELTDTAEAIGSADLRRRAPKTMRDDEVGRLARVFNEMLERLEVGFDQAKRFAADASHELRTPLTILHGQMDQLLRQGSVSENVEENLLSMQEEITRLERICAHLLLLSQFDAGQVALALRPTDFSLFVAATCDDARILADARSISFESDINPGIGVMCDPDYMRRLLFNLFENAVKFNHEGGQVRVFLTRTGESAKLRVENTNPGIPEQERARVFERFYQTDRSGGGSGNGLGLSLGREIAQSHGGRLDVASDPPTGWVVFELLLPMSHS